MAYYKDLREFLKFLEERGKLYRYGDPINKETELVPFHRVQMRGLPEEERRAILFEKPVGAHGETYDMSVLVGAYAASEQLLAWGLGCETYQEAVERFHYALGNPIPTKLVEDGPVHEEVHVGDELKELGLDEIPVPVEEVGFSGIVRFGMPMLSKDPDTGDINLGAYNGFFRDRDRLAAGIASIRVTMLEHWRKHRERGEDLPVAIIVGAVPTIMTTASALIPYGTPGVDEYTVAGGIAGEPVELVRCKTVPLEVPARAEMVIEGYLSADVLEPRTPFGEYPGYLSTEMTMIPVIRVTAITHRKNAIFTNVIVGMYPSDCNVVAGFAKTALMYRHLKYERGLPVEEVYYPQEAGGGTICLIRMQDGVTTERVWETLHAAAEHPRIRLTKYYIAVDSDINVRDNETILWALASRSQPQWDIQTVPGGAQGGLDPSAAPTGSMHGLMDTAVVKEEGRTVLQEYSRMLINATRNWPYPPVALPAKQYMERAVELWKARADLPEPRMRWPWYGYTLGYWPEDMEEVAELITQGEYRKVGEMMKKLQQPVKDEMVVTDSGSLRNRD